MLSLMPRTNYGLNRFFDNRFDHFFDDMFSNPFFRTGSGMQMPSMRTDVKEKDGMYTLEMDLPGYDKADIKAELNNGYLTISASKDTGDQEKKDEESGYVCRERYTGSCSRSFYVGDSVKEEDIRAGYNNGILTLSFPKETAPQIPEKKYIAIE